MGEDDPDHGRAESDPDDQTTGEARVERRPPKEVFSLLGNETRIAILYTLDESSGEPVSFSELRERVGTRDSGQFNYHLGKLADHFVRKTDDGYELTVAGTGIVGALRAGRYTADVSIDPIELDDPCPRCGGTIRVTYEDEYVRMEYADCDDWGNQFTVPPGTIEQFDREELPEAFDRWLGTTVERTIAGFCPNCSGRLEGILESDPDRVHGVAATFDCDRCGVVAKTSPASILYFHPAAVSFYHDHGIDVLFSPSWKIDRGSDRTVEQLETDPVRVRVEITIDDERLVATIDETASVVSVERRSG
jgi:DNA-binding transcriptional ArsR family regulator